jgi:hypothetical protein
MMLCPQLNINHLANPLVQKVIKTILSFSESRRSEFQRQNAIIQDVPKRALQL